METTHDTHFEGRWWQWPPLRNGLSAGLIATLAFVFAHLDLISQSLENMLYMLSIPIGGWYWMREGAEALISEREISIDLLMIAATTGAALLGLWDEAAFLVFLYATAEGLEEYTYARARSAIRALLDLAPKEACLLKGNDEIIVPAEQLVPGDRFRVRPGQSIPTDGIIRAGTSSLDESQVTGEAVPVDKQVGMQVFAGSLNQQGALEVEVTKTFADNTLSKMIHLVESAQEQKGKAQQWIDRFGRVYSPAVLLASFCMILIPWLLGLPMADWSLRAVILLVAAAPCALIMSMPVAMAAGIGSAGKRGILIKGGLHLEHLGVIRVVAFDKTGTLTLGIPSVSDLVTLKGPEAEWLSVAAGLEQYSEHPLGKAIFKKAKSRGSSAAKVLQFEALTGAGALGVFAGQTWYIGNPDLFLDMGIALDKVSNQIKALQASGKTVVLIGTKKEVYGMITLQDQIRAESVDTIARLHQMGIKIAMLTGDNSLTANAVALPLGIDDVRAGLKPEEKVQAIKDLEKQYGPVLMVGDGVNDAPALAVATCGACMGAAGSDAAIEAADVALMADDLGKVEEALHLGRVARQISKQNIVFSLIVLALLIPSALGGFLSVAAVVFFHEVSELLAVANGLRVAKAL